MRRAVIQNLFDLPYTSISVPYFHQESYLSVSFTLFFWLTFLSWIPYKRLLIIIKYAILRENREVTGHEA